MPEPLLDPQWYRVADLRPRLRPHVQLHRHHYRGQRWYVIQDAGTGRYHRFSAVAHRLIGLMDGRRSLGRIWELAARELGDDVPTQGETLRLLHQLHAADVLQTDINADTEERVRRFDRERRRKWQQQLKSPLAVRVPLVDPERFLAATAWLVRPLFGWLGLLLWLTVVGTAVVLAAMHWEALAADVSGRLLAPQNLLLMWLAFPVVKALHELGHGYAVKHWGGEVHQIGIMFLVFMPVPYVDASSATAFRDKYQRALVGAMGMVVEVLLAALALFVWLAVEPGLVKALAYNVMIIAGVSTLLFNGNPLLRFDAYYILADLLEIPNLASRANRYVFYLVKRHWFGLKELESPASAPGEARWFLLYAPASFVYRMVIFAAIVVFVAGQFFFIGVLLALWAAFSLFVMPTLKGAHYLLNSPELGRRRPRALGVTGLLLAGVLVLLFAVPVPLATVAEGVVWAPEGTQVRARAAGFVDQIRAANGAAVTLGELLVTLNDPLLEPELRVLQGERAALEARYDLVRREDRTRAQIVQEQLDNLDARIARKREQLADLQVRAPRTGTLVLPDARDLPDRYVRQGELLGYVTDDAETLVRAVVTQDEVDLVRNRTRRVHLRSAQDPHRAVPAQLNGEVPSASLELPSPALGSTGGGRIPVDPTATEGAQALEKVFQFDLVAAGAALAAQIGERVHVRFDHGWEPVGWTLYRWLQRLFLRHFAL
ncbi:HlyD family efflux transporter periplasmic adaptor subunit [uncultured Thiohalocapsa sp.]|uniref:HlyD family efflux transporter periplasmic adaptor subunit n=1 Tax=uncultured Thiohalocapsa sp. TaxID=768990 RepID=UPI0025D51CC8|nr:HlyD family efflux transporter periplasmic adaptor subunit [uncultured Thiohalocapsa sp.]